MIVDKFPWYTKTPIKNMAKGLTKAGHIIDIYSLKMPKWITEVSTEDVAHEIMYKQPELGNYDIVCCQYGNIGIQFANIEKQLENVPKLVTCFRGSDITSIYRATRENYSLLFEQGDLFLPVCRHYREKLIQIGCNSEKIVVHYSPIDFSKFYCKRFMRSKKKPIIIASVNRLDQKKGMEDAIKAVTMLIKDGYELKYYIAGDGGERKKLQHLIYRSGMAEHITLLGWLTHEEVYDLLKQADIFLLPSVTTNIGIQEGIPNALKEAMASGLPIVSTRHSGITELVEDTVSGFLVEEHDVVAIKISLERLINNPRLCYKMGKNGSKTIFRYFDIENNTRVLEQLFFNLLDRT
jgi:colanic acid/amylovoran biosynthesis glycosyltransferase